MRSLQPHASVLSGYGQAAGRNDGRVLHRSCEDTLTADYGYTLYKALKTNAILLASNIVVSLTSSRASNMPPAAVQAAQPRMQHGLARVLTGGECVYEDSYDPKNILLTGGAGFIGSHVASLLLTKYPQYKVCRDTAT
jgi:hypothetical protein